MGIMNFIIDKMLNRDLKNQVNEINNKYDLTESALDNYEYIKGMYKSGLVDPFELTYSIKLNWTKSQIEIYSNKVTSFISDTDLDLNNNIIQENDFNIIKDKSDELLKLITFEFEKINEISSPEDASIEIKRIKTLLDDNYNFFKTEVNKLYNEKINFYFNKQIEKTKTEVEETINAFVIENSIISEVVIKKKAKNDEDLQYILKSYESTLSRSSKENRVILNYVDEIISLHKKNIEKSFSYFLEDSENFKKYVSIWGNDIAKKIYNKEVWIKMNNEQLLSSRGKPTNIEKEQTIESTTETWIYGNKNTGNYFVLVDNIVTRIVDR